MIKIFVVMPQKCLLKQIGLGVYLGEGIFTSIYSRQYRCSLTLIYNKSINQRTIPSTSDRMNTIL